jgi:hypothetical protein
MENEAIEAGLLEALNTVSEFVRQVTGREATQSEIADALARYFVLNEIKDHVVMLREVEGGQGEAR